MLVFNEYGIREIESIEVDDDQQQQQQQASTNKKWGREKWWVDGTLVSSCTFEENIQFCWIKTNNLPRLPETAAAVWKRWETGENNRNKKKTNQNNDFIEHDVFSNSPYIPLLSFSLSLWLFLSPSLYIFHLSHAQSLYPAFGSLSANVGDDYWFRCQFVCCCGARNSSCPMKFCLEFNKIDDYCL